ncbi:FCP1-like domain, HAD-like domain protein [Artemisia annua]|uniref:FCP1-like domain, HAD-like domain protein n=1 Tax=Artemisia annua TaxID=35608 RepID=A0A2U1NRF9_ARTAN|nr:FCP1-like domain, HAD-like domain protein [Artemisia annua]
MDRTLIHSILSSPSNPPPKKYDFIVKYSKSIGYVTKRPYVDEFLEYLKENNFEIVIFTAGDKSYASLLLDILDPKGLISHRLYRDSCKSFQGNLVKDLSCLGRNLNNVVIVDDNPHYTILQRKNAIRIRPLTDDLQDHELRKLMNDFFKECNRYNNMQDAVKHYRHAARVQHNREKLTRSSKQARVFEDEEYGLLKFIYLDDQ